MEDIIEHDKNEDATEMDEDTEALITENWCFGIKETLGRDKLVWNRLMENNFMLVFVYIYIMYIFCHLLLLAWKWPLEGWN